MASTQPAAANGVVNEAGGAQAAVAAQSQSLRDGAESGLAQGSSSAAQQVAPGAVLAAEAPVADAANSTNSADKAAELAARADAEAKDAAGEKGNKSADDAVDAPGGDNNGQDAEAALSFTVDVQSADRDVAKHLEKHLDIQRFTRFADLRATELNRLMLEADANARSLLAAQGYFNPVLRLRLEEAQPGGEGVRKIVMEVEPGPQSTIRAVDLTFAEPMASDAAAQAQRERVHRRWSLKPQAAFSQSEWDSAKNTGLRILQRERYPTARIAHSQATVQADDNLVDLAVEYDAGQPYRFGALELKGNERYDAQGIRNIARIPTGADYSEDALLDAQQRLVNSGYFDSAFLMVDTENSDPQHATVIAQLREAPYQKLVFGLGFSTDAGPRISLDHTHNKIWPWGWRAVSQISLDAKSQLLSSQWTAMPKPSGWAWFTGAKLERAEAGDFTANNFMLTAGRTKSVGHIDRRYYFQYDFSRLEGSSGPGSSSSLLASYSWTGRYFNDNSDPTRGYGLGAELGAGFTLTPEREPFLRTRLRWMQFVPFGSRNEAGKRSRLAVRAEGGAIIANSGVQAPISLLFLSGGDSTVRGYSYQSIGTRGEDGKLYGGRYMLAGSVEWQRPITLLGNSSDWEHALFVDAGGVSNERNRMDSYVGVGTGIRWRSPVGPLQADVAYGLKTEEVRLHLRMGFYF